jgi:hypothetical protein
MMDPDFKKRIESAFAKQGLNLVEIRTIDADGNEISREKVDPSSNRISKYWRSLFFLGAVAFVLWHVWERVARAGLTST